MTLGGRILLTLRIHLTFGRSHNLCVIFNQHIAAGNSTRAGIFGLFYGIPGTYWHAMLANQQSPLMIDRLQQLNYQMGIFTAAQLHQPEFDQTVFVNIDNLRIGSAGSSPSALDANLVKDWTQWYAQRDKQRPVFSFLFFDSPHGYDFPNDYPHHYGVFQGGCHSSLKY
ncbi:MAG: sulfatase-like hydrolase/transferase [Shewanella sp.]